jgi:hypothetical protein
VRDGGDDTPPVDDTKIPFGKRLVVPLKTVQGFHVARLFVSVSAYRSIILFYISLSFYIEEETR